MFVVMGIGLLPLAVHANPTQAKTTTNATITIPNETTNPPSWWIGGTCDKTGYYNDQGYSSSSIYTWGGFNVCYGQRKNNSWGRNIIVTGVGSNISVPEFQCVELVARFISEYYHLGAVVADGSQIVDTYTSTDPTVFHKVSNSQAPTLQIAPIAGDVISFNATKDNDSGHTAIVTGSTVGSDGNGAINIIQQNVAGHPSDTIQVSNWNLGNLPSTGASVYDWMTTRSLNLPGGWWVTPSWHDTTQVSPSNPLTIKFHAAKNSSDGIEHVDFTRWTKSTNSWNTFKQFYVGDGAEISDSITITEPTILSADVYGPTGRFQLAPNGMIRLCYPDLSHCPPKEIVYTGPSIGGGGDPNPTPTPSPSNGIKICSGSNYNGTCNTFTYTGDNGTVQALGSLSHNQDSMQFLGSYVNAYDVVFCLRDGCPSGDREIQHDDPNFDNSITKNQYVAIRIVKNAAPIPNSDFTVYSETNYGGNHETFTYTSHDTCIPLDQMAGHNKSVKDVGYSAVMYHDSNCGTYLARYDNDNSDIGWGLYNQFSSMRLEKHILSAPDSPGNPTPADGTALPEGTKQVTLSWDWNSASESQIHEWTDGGYNWSSDWYNGASMTVSNLYPLTLHWQVKTRNGKGESPLSPVWTFTVQSSGPPTPLPEGSIKEGGLNLDAYCQSINLPVSGVINGIWYCGNGTVTLDLTKACQWQYSDSTSFSFEEQANNAYSWNCYAPPVPAQGTWNSPSDNFTVVKNGTLHFSANVTGSNVSKVNFRASWDGVTWVDDICTMPVNDSHLYECDWNIAGNNIPDNTYIRTAFDAYDANGTKILSSPAGDRNGIYSVPQTPPTVTSSNYTVIEDQTQTNTITTTYTGSNTLNLTASNLPSFASFNDNGDGTGTVTLTPNTGNAGNYTFTVTASDGIVSGNGSFTIAVTPALNAKPVSPGNNTVLPVGTTETDITWTGTGPFHVELWDARSSSYYYVWQDGYVGQSYHLTGLQPGQTYQWQIAGANKVYSQFMSFTIAPNPKIFENFSNGKNGWTFTNSVVNTKDGTNGILRFTNPSKVSTAVKAVNTTALSSYNTITIRINLHGATLPSGSSAQLFLDQNGIKYVPLSTYVKQKVNGWQTITIPLSAFKGFDKTKSFAKLGISMTTGTKMTIDFDDITFIYR